MTSSERERMINTRSLRNILAAEQAKSVKRVLKVSGDQILPEQHSIGSVHHYSFHAEMTDCKNQPR